MHKKQLSRKIDILISYKKHLYIDFKKRCKYKNDITRMITSISSEARRNQISILISGRENHVSP